MPNQRRSFLKILAATPLVACAANSAAPEQFGDVPAGNVSDTSVGTLAPVSGAPAVLGRDENGLYAMTNTCTHQGCPVTPAAGATLYCSCHGSRFDSNGAVLSGPANGSLVHYAVTIDADGNITVNGATEVASAVRTPIA
ncbi:MAG: Rieske (2Fe-2S) protein [Pseudomonadota bacterium]